MCEGGLQREGVDYVNTSLQCCFALYRVLFALAASTGWAVHQTDITQAYTYGELDQGLRSIATFLTRFPCRVANISTTKTAGASEEDAAEGGTSANGAAAGS